MADVTQMLNRSLHDVNDARSLLDIVYGELRRLAAARMYRESSPVTLQPTALVHEAWLRVSKEGCRWENRAHFFGAAAEAMRRIMIDRARRRRALRHGGDLERVDVDSMEIASPDHNDDELLAVHEALDRLAAEDPPKAELVKLRFFVGLTLEEAGEVLGFSERTAKRHWAYARAWLRDAIHQG